MSFLKNSGRTQAFQLDSPVVGTGSAQFDGGVAVLRYEPMETGVCDQAHVLPVLLGEVAAVCVKVPEEHHVLLRNIGRSSDLDTLKKMLTNLTLAKMKVVLV